ncbi:hypothetical protein KIN20_035390 [Parelaphostrongylus tenuis]|uniref:Uncharacterized protein n=1 Tax=Parelaphostrongylus tenuis TaxID=148309 RepID=A0AAD5RB26_PARTN|nr:hypothetical protein KIN20_035390 [Parelaphostrongylus tenuis]
MARMAECVTLTPYTTSRAVSRGAASVFAFKWPLITSHGRPLGSSSSSSRFALQISLGRCWSFANADRFSLSYFFTSGQFHVSWLRSSLSASTLLWIVKQLSLYRQKEEEF